ncbi:MAG TPA: hypothetical protein PK867_28110 [Pirellulales bacterium]|nr:hypothetical protein [Pirellulales bacterium]
MRFEYRTFWLAKDADEPTQYQDAFDLDSELGRAAIADGVSSTIFSGPWARLLALAAVAEPPPLEDSAAFQTWMAENRTAWINNIDTSKLTWYQRPKMADGAMTTLLWLELLPDETNDEELATRYQLQAYAIGDSCLFHVRDEATLYWFPLESSTEFGLNPAVVASVDRQLDHLLEFKARSQECLPGDLLVLTTDAVALWAIERHESGEAVDWPRYWDLSDEEWRAEIFALRDAKQMRFDDSTLVLLRVIEERPAPVTWPVELEPLDAESVLSEETVAGEATPAEAPAPDEPTEPAIASLTEAVENREALRFDAAVTEGVDSLEAIASADGSNETERPPELVTDETTTGDRVADGGDAQGEREA